MALLPFRRAATLARAASLPIPFELVSEIFAPEFMEFKKQRSPYTRPFLGCTEGLKDGEPILYADPAFGMLRYTHEDHSFIPAGRDLVIAYEYARGKDGKTTWFTGTIYEEADGTIVALQPQKTLMRITGFLQPGDSHKFTHGSAVAATQLPVVGQTPEMTPRQMWSAERQPLHVVDVSLTGAEPKSPDYPHILQALHMACTVKKQLFKGRYAPDEAVETAITLTEARRPPAVHGGSYMPETLAL